MIFFISFIRLLDSGLSKEALLNKADPKKAAMPRSALWELSAKSVQKVRKSIFKYLHVLLFYMVAKTSNLKCFSKIFFLVNS